MISEALFDQAYHVTLNAEAITIQGTEGYVFITIKVKNGTVSVSTNTGTIGGKACTAGIFELNETFSFGSGLSSVDNLTIDATSGIVEVWGLKISNPPL